MCANAEQKNKPAHRCLLTAFCFLVWRGGRIPAYAEASAGRRTTEPVRDLIYIAPNKGILFKLSNLWLVIQYFQNWTIILVAVFA